MLEQNVEIINKLGLHARAATKFASTANKFNSKIQVIFGDKTIDGKSIMALMLLAAAKGSVITLSTDGPDAEQALSALLELINNRFDEDE
ncbi:MAG: HPr family phosphocarrier protein [Agarilytica sp.]